MERSRLRLALLVTAVAMVVEVAGGLWTGSLALLSDAAHMITHALSLGVSLWAIVIAARPATVERSYGHYRVEVLAALFNGATLLLFAGLIGYEAVERLRHPVAVMAWQMMGIAAFGLVINLLTAAILHGAHRDDLNVRSAFLHMLGDTFSSVAVVAGGLVIALTGWRWLDPVLSMAVCLVLVLWSIGLLRGSTRILLEATPQGLDCDALARTLRDASPLIQGIHHLHVWTITSGIIAMTADVVLPGATPLSEQSALADRLRRLVRERHCISHAMFEFEPRERDHAHRE